MKRKLLRLLLCLMVTLPFVLPGCGGAPAAPPSVAPSGAATTAPAPATTVAPAPVAQGEKLEWKWNSYYASGDQLIEADYYMAKKISDLTGGRFTVKIFPSGQLTSSTECANSISSGAFSIGSATTPSGTRDMAWRSYAYYFTAIDFQNWYYGYGGKQITQHIANEKFNVQFFMNQIISADSGWRSNKPLLKMEDFKGMKIRCGAIETQDIIKQWGASAMFLSGNDIYQAAKLGTIDAFEFVGPPTDWTLGFNEIEKYWVYPAWYQTFTAYTVGVNLDAWKKLPKEFQTAIEAASELSLIRSQVRGDLLNAEYAKKFIDYGTTRMSDQLFSDLKPVVKKAIEDSCAINPNTAAGYHSEFEYLKKINIWKRLSQPWTYGYVVPDEDYPVIKDEWLPDWYKKMIIPKTQFSLNPIFEMPLDWE